jgi:esterase
MLLASRIWKTKTSDSQQRVLFLHGLGGTGDLWRPIASVLEEACVCLSPDQRGHGQSQVAQDDHQGFQPLAYGIDLVETLEAESFYPVWVIGHSMGVRSAMALAHLRPEWIKGMILVDLGLSGGGLGTKLSFFIDGLPETFPTAGEAKTYLEQHCPDKAIASYLLATLQQQFKKGEVGRFPFSKHALSETLRATHTDMRDWLWETSTRFTTPILALRGGRSKVWSLRQFEMDQQYFAQHGNIQFETFEHCGHGLPFEARLQFIDRVKQFLKLTPLATL